MPEQSNGPAPVADGDLTGLASRLTHAREPRAALKLIAALRSELDALERANVARALTAGASFASVGRDLGVSRQVVHRRHGDLVPDGGRRTRINERRFEPSAPGAAGLSVTPDARLVLRHASAEAEASGDASVGTEHLLLALLRPGALPALGQDGIALTRARTQVYAAASGSRVFARDGARPDAHELLAAVAHEARRLEVDEVTPELLLRAALADPASPAARTLRALGADPGALLARLDVG